MALKWTRDELFYKMTNKSSRSRKCKLFFDSVLSMVDDYENLPHITAESLLSVTQILAIFSKLFLKVWQFISREKFIS